MTAEKRTVVIPIDRDDVAIEDGWMAGEAECFKGLVIWRDHKFVNGICVNCGMKLQ